MNSFLRASVTETKLHCLWVNREFCLVISEIFILNRDDAIIPLSMMIKKSQKSLRDIVEFENRWSGLLNFVFSNWEIFRWMFLGYPRLSPLVAVGCCCWDVAQVQTNQDQVRNRFVRLVTVGKWHWIPRGLQWDHLLYSIAYDVGN